MSGVWQTATFLLNISASILFGIAGSLWANELGGSFEQIVTAFFVGIIGYFGIVLALILVITITNELLDR